LTEAAFFAAAAFRFANLAAKACGIAVAAFSNDAFRSHSPALPAGILPAAASLAGAKGLAAAAAPLLKASAA